MTIISYTRLTKLRKAEFNEKEIIIFFDSGANHYAPRTFSKESPVSQYDADSFSAAADLQLLADDRRYDGISGLQERRAVPRADHEMGGTQVVQNAFQESDVQASDSQHAAFELVRSGGFVPDLHTAGGAFE